MTSTQRRPRLAVWKLASCDGCQLSILDCQDELLALASSVEIAHFAEATTTSTGGPYDVSLVEGSVSTREDAERLQRIRERSEIVVAIGACATAGGIQALRNFGDLAEFSSVVYAQPTYVQALATSTPLTEHISVDAELRGCPIDKRQLIELVSALLAGRKPQLPAQSVCFECKRRGTTCVLVARQTPCLGPVTQAGCGAICPAYGRGCYGCFGPLPDPNTPSLVPRLAELGMPAPAIERVFSTFNVAAPGFSPGSRAQAAGRSAGAGAQAEITEDG